MKPALACLIGISVCGAGVAQDRSVWAGAGVTLQGAPSPDGKWLSFVNPVTGALAVRGLESGVSRDVAVRPVGSKEFAYFSVFSPDSERLAYAWFNEAGFYELRVTALDAATPPVTLYRNSAAGFVQPCAWTPDGKWILTLLFRRDNISQIALVPAAGGAPRILRSLNWVYPKKMDLSPDGKWLVYDNFAQEGGEDRAIFLLSMDGASETRLTTVAGNYLFPMWHPDGARVWFAGDQGGSPQLYSIGVKEGKALGVLQRTAITPGRILPLGITRAGMLYYGVRTGKTDVYEGSGAVVTKFAGRNSKPGASGSGRWLAYLSRRGTENFGHDERAIVVQDLQSGEERELAVSLAHIERVAWSPDEQTLLVAGSDGKGRGGLFLVSVADGETRPFAVDAGGAARGFEGQWSADGATVFYLHGGDELRAKDVLAGTEKVLVTGQALGHLAVSPDGAALAVGVGGQAVRMISLQGDGIATVVPFAGLTDLFWAEGLVAVRRGEWWNVPLDGAAGTRTARVPEGVLEGVSVGAGGKVYFSVGGEISEVRAVKLP